MTSSEAALFKSEFHRLASDVSVMLTTCQREGQLSCGAHLVQARESLFAALKSFNPKTDERNLDLLDKTPPLPSGNQKKAAVLLPCRAKTENE